MLEEQRIKRGVIRAADGEVLAGSTRAVRERYGRRYPTGRLFALAVGFDVVRFGRAGLERYYNDALIGRKDELGGSSTRWSTKTAVGDDLRTTLAPRRSRSPTTRSRPQGRRRRARRQDRRRARAGRDAVLRPGPARPRLDVQPATQGLFPPGSTFKTVTATAAIDSGRYQPDSRVSGKNGKVISGTPLNNFGSQDFGDITLTEALTNSVNTVWAEVGVKLGRKTMQEYMDRFGFGEEPPMDYPADQMIAERPATAAGAVIPMSSGRVDVGRTAIGQALLLVTPLQMATVAQTIGNGGVRMEPRLVEKVIDPDGRTVDEPLPQRGRARDVARERRQGRRR